MICDPCCGWTQKELNLRGRFTVEDKLLYQLLKDRETMVLSTVESRERKECSRKSEHRKGRQERVPERVSSRESARDVNNNR